ERHEETYRAWPDSRGRRIALLADRLPAASAGGCRLRSNAPARAAGGVPRHRPRAGFRVGSWLPQLGWEHLRLGSRPMGAAPTRGRGLGGRALETPPQRVVLDR